MFTVVDLGSARECYFSFSYGVQVAPKLVSLYVSVSVKFCTQINVFISKSLQTSPDKHPAVQVKVKIYQTTNSDNLYLV